MAAARDKRPIATSDSLLVDLRWVLSTIEGCEITGMQPPAACPGAGGSALGTSFGQPVVGAVAKRPVTVPPPVRAVAVPADPGSPPVALRDLQSIEPRPLNVLMEEVAQRLPSASTTSILSMALSCLTEMARRMT